jgi:hypothetical protein
MFFPLASAIAWQPEGRHLLCWTRVFSAFSSANIALPKQPEEGRHSAEAE